MSSPIETTYQQEIDWLFQQFPSYQNIGVNAYKPDLGNIQELIKQLNLDLSALSFIHVAGTNGKGTCTNYLGSILIEAGYTTGIFTSPHIVDFRERMLVNGEMVEEQFVIDFCQKIKHLEIEPSFFEITFAMALAYFIRKKCRFVVLETGLGGRLDATNVVTPILSIITNIGLDHVHILGDTLEKIAEEKAGIIKPNTPVIIGEYTDETLPVFQKTAAKNHAELIFVNDVEIKKTHFSIQNFKQKNERIIVKAIDVLQQKKISISTDAVENGFQNIYINTSYKGRFQQVADAPTTIVDVAHNEDGFRDLLQSIAQINYHKLHIVYGSSADKDFKTILAMFPKETNVYFTEFTNDRSVKINEIQHLVKETHPNTLFFKNIKTAMLEVQKKSTITDLVLITGSFFLISDYFRQIHPTS